MRPAALAVAAACLLAGAPAGAADARFGLFVGSNAAPADAARAALRHAEADAERLREVFVELGGVRAADAELLRSPSSAELLAAVRRLAERAAGTPGAVVVFFYSGHADARALLLGPSELPLVELTAALDAVPARLSVQVVDACRSGALTRAKGVQLGAALAEAPVLAEATVGRVVIAAAGASEDAHESDLLGGSFFATHLATGLRGAADADADAAVTLDEAYAYAYARTVESTRATLAGAQHPTYRFDLRGHGRTVLTQLGAGATGELELDPGGEWLVVSARTGRLVAEARPTGAGERLALAPGAYRVSVRSHDTLREGEVDVGAGARVRASTGLTRTRTLASLVPKGRAADGGDPRGELGVELGGRGALGARSGVAPMVRMYYRWPLGPLTLRPHLSFAGAGTTGPLVTPRLALDLRELGAGADLRREWILGPARLGAGGVADALWLSQSDPSGREARRDALGLALGAVAGASVTPAGRWVVGVTGEALAYTFPASEAERAPASGAGLATVFTWRALFTAAWRFE